MKVKITVMGANVVMDMEENDAMKMFRKLSAQLLGIVQGADRVDGEAGGRENAAQESRQQEAQVSIEKLYIYRGFLYVKCPVCGNTYGYCSSESTTHFYCRQCGRKHTFTEPLKPLHLNCECGKHSKYMTNMDEEMFDVICIQCKSPVAVRYNGKRKSYETIRN